MKLPILDESNLCNQCVALCCRYFAFNIEAPTTKRDFEDLRWYLLHEDTILFVEDGDWYLQVNRPCKALLPDSRCGIYETRPTICRGYKTDKCDWHGDEYGYEQLFTEPEQIARFAKEYLARRRKRAMARKRATQPATRARAAAVTAVRTRRARRRGMSPVRLLKSA